MRGIQTVVSKIHYSAEEVAALIRRYIYGLDYYDEEWNQVVANGKCSEGDELSLTVAYYAFLTSDAEEAGFFDEFSIYPNLLALAFVFEKGLTKEIQIDNEIERISNGSPGDTFMGLLDVEPYRHFSDIAHQLSDKRRMQIRHRVFTAVMASLLSILVTVGLIGYFQ